MARRDLHSSLEEVLVFSARMEAVFKGLVPTAMAWRNLLGSCIWTASICWADDICGRRHA